MRYCVTVGNKTLFNVAYRAASHVVHYVKSSPLQC